MSRNVSPFMISLSVPCQAMLFASLPIRGRRCSRRPAGSTVLRMRATLSTSTSGDDCLRLPRPRFQAEYIQVCCIMRTRNYYF